AYTYDQNGNITTVTPPDRPAHDFSYDLLDMLSAATVPAAGPAPRTTAYAYDNPDHDLTKITRPSGATAGLTYDSAGRLTTLTEPEGATTSTYDPATGNLNSLRSPDNQDLDFAFDGPLPTRQRMTGPVTATTTQSYDDDFRLATATAAGDSVSYRYDADGLLTGAGDLTVTREPENGLPTGSSIATLATAITHTPYGEPADELTRTDTTALYRASYTRDDLGRITTKQETRPNSTTTWAYNYDAAGRLANVTKNAAQHAAYSYDQNGNRTSSTIDGVTTYASFDARDRISSQGDLDLTYNANGELIAKTDRTTDAQTSFTYSTLGDLTAATTPDGTEIDYLLDPLGRRVGKKVDGAITQGFLYSPEAMGPVAELTPANNLRSRFVYATRSWVPDYMVRGGETFKLVTDQLGSVVMVVDVATGAIEQEISYSPFGEVLTDSNPGFQPFGFAGGLYDGDTGLTHFGAREYDAEMGRWTASDPISFAGGDTNLYGYVINDPVNFVDPSGLFLQQLSDFAAGFGDAATFGGTKWVRQKLGVNGVVNECSGWYTGGKYAGWANLAAVTAGAGGLLVTKYGVEATALYALGRGKAVQYGVEVLAKHPDFVEKAWAFYNIYSKTIGRSKF
ncbi:MAG: RHS repeat-associated core domain-containing protein, partial [Solirubrobacterales bacterium]